MESKCNYLKKSAGCGYFCTVWYTSHLDGLFFANSGTIFLPVEIMIWRSLEKTIYGIEKDPHPHFSNFRKCMLARVDIRHAQAHQVCSWLRFAVLRSLDSTSEGQCLSVFSSVCSLSVGLFFLKNTKSLIL